MKTDLCPKQKADTASVVTTKHNGSYLNNSTNRSPLKFTSSYAIREISHILNNPTFRYRVHKKAPLVLITKDINPIQTVPLYPFWAQFNIVFHLQLGLPSAFFHSDFLPQP